MRDTRTQSPTTADNHSMTTLTKVSMSVTALHCKDLMDSMTEIASFHFRLCHGKWWKWETRKILIPPSCSRTGRLKFPVGGFGKGVKSTALGCNVSCTI